MKIDLLLFAVFFWEEGGVGVGVWGEGLYFFCSPSLVVYHRWGGDQEGVRLWGGGGWLMRAAGPRKQEPVVEWIDRQQLRPRR